jgi:hypothetical protein
MKNIKMKTKKLTASLLLVSILMTLTSIGTFGIPAGADNSDLSREALLLELDALEAYIWEIEDLADILEYLGEYEELAAVLEYRNELLTAYEELEALLAATENLVTPYNNGNGNGSGDDEPAPVPEEEPVDAITTPAPNGFGSDVDGEVLSVRTVYSILAIAIAESTGSEVPANPIGFAQTVGLIDATDMLRYRLETGRAFDWDAPITRQEYAIAVDRMVHVLRRFGIGLMFDTTASPSGIRQQLNSTEGIVRLEGNAPLTSEHGIGSTSSQFRDNVSEFRVGRTGSVGNQDVNAGSGRRLGEFEDGHEVRGSARVSIMSALNWGALSPKSFDELTNEDAIERAVERGRRQQAVAERQVVLDRGLFAAPNDNLTVGELVALDEAFLNLSLSVESIMALID